MGKGLGITEQITPPVIAFDKAWEVSRMDVVVITTDVPIVDKHVHIYLFDKDMVVSRVNTSSLQKKNTEGTAMEYLIDVRGADVIQMIYSLNFLPDTNLIAPESELADIVDTDQVGENIGV